MYTPLQAYREIPFSGFSPYAPVRKLPTGAYLGQTIKTHSPDNATFRIMRANEEIGDSDDRTPHLVASQNWYVVATPSVDNYPVGTSEIPKGTSQIKLDIRLKSEEIYDNSLAGSKGFIVQGLGIGSGFYVKHNVVTGPATNREYVITIDPATQLALNTQSGINLRKPYYSQITGGPAGNGKINGVALTTIPEAHYFLALVRGIVPLQMDAGQATAAASNANRAVAIARTQNAKNRIKVAVAGERVIGHILNPAESIAPEAWYMINFNVV